MNETATPQDQNLFSGKKPSISELSKKLVSFDDAQVETADGVPTSKYLTQIVQKYGSGTQQQPAGTPAAAPKAQPAAAIPATQPEAPITQPDTPNLGTVGQAQMSSGALSNPAAVPAAGADPMAQPQAQPQKYQPETSVPGDTPMDPAMGYKQPFPGKSNFQSMLMNIDDTDLQARIDTVRKESSTEEFQRYVDEVNRSQSPQVAIDQLRKLDMLNHGDYITAKAARDADNSLPGKILGGIGDAISSFANDSSEGAARIKTALGGSKDSLQVPVWEQSKDDSALMTALKTPVNMLGGIVNMTTDPGQLINAINPAQIKRMATFQGYNEGKENLTQAGIGAASVVLPELLGAEGNAAAAALSKYPKLAPVVNMAKAVVKSPITVPVAAVKGLGKVSGVSDFLSKVFQKDRPMIDQLNKNPFVKPIVESVAKTTDDLVGNLSSITLEDFAQTAKNNAIKSLNPIYDSLREKAAKGTVDHGQFISGFLDDALKKSDLAMDENGVISHTKGGPELTSGGIEVSKLPEVATGIDKVVNQISGIDKATGKFPTLKQMLDRYLTMKNSDGSLFPKDNANLPIAKSLEKNVYKAIEDQFKKNGVDLTNANKKYAQSMLDVDTLAKNQYSLLKKGNKSAAQNVIGSVKGVIDPVKLGSDLTKSQPEAVGLKSEVNPGIMSSFKKSIIDRNAKNLQPIAGAVGAVQDKNNDQTQQSGQGATQQPGKKMSKAEAQAYMKSLGL